MKPDTEVEQVARIIAEDASKRLKLDPLQRHNYVNNMWPAFIEAAEDIMIFLLGDEFQLEKGTENEEDDPRATPVVVCNNPRCTGEC